MTEDFIIRVTVDPEVAQGDEFELVRDHLLEAFEEPVCRSVFPNSLPISGFFLKGVTVEIICPDDLRVFEDN